MPRFIIEREIDGASELTPVQLAEIAQTSNQAVASLGVPYRWVNSYVAGNKIYCVHETEDVDTIREHARRGGFPANVVAEVANEFGPQTVELLARPEVNHPVRQAPAPSPWPTATEAARP